MSICTRHIFTHRWVSHTHKTCQQKTKEYLSHLQVCNMSDIKITQTASKQILFFIYNQIIFWNVCFFYFLLFSQLYSWLGLQWKKALQGCTNQRYPQWGLNMYWGHGFKPHWGHFWFVYPCKAFFHCKCGMTISGYYYKNSWGVKSICKCLYINYHFYNGIW